MAEIAIIKKLGHGAFGDVYLVQDEDGKQFALKVADVSRLQRCKGPQFDLESEAKLLRKLCHPHLVQCCGHFLQGTFLYMITEFCPCGTLRQYLQKRKRYISEGKVLQWTGQLADVLRYLHASKIIHRDIKTENVFLDIDQNVKLGDLGIARELQHTEEQVASNVGTRNYMSPEVLFGVNYTTKTDIWSLGCCIHETMTLRPTFQTASMWEQMERIQKGRVPPVPDVYSQQLQELLLVMLNRNPDRRPDALEILITVSQISGVPYKSGPLEEIGKVAMDSTSIVNKVHKFQIGAELSRKDRSSELTTSSLPAPHELTTSSFSAPHELTTSSLPALHELTTSSLSAPRNSFTHQETKVQPVPRPLPQPRGSSPSQKRLIKSKHSHVKIDNSIHTSANSSQVNESETGRNKNLDDSSPSSTSGSESVCGDWADNITLTPNMSPRSFLSQAQDTIDPSFMESREWLQKRFQPHPDNEVPSKKSPPDLTAEVSPESESQVTLYTRAQHVRFHKTPDNEDST